jgi:integrase
MYKLWLSELAKRPVEQVTEIELQRIINRMLSLNKAPPTADKLKRLLIQVLNLALKKELVKTNHARALRIPKYDDAIQLPLSIEEMRRLYHTIMCWGEPIYRGIFVFLLHGRRVSEVLTLTWGNIDLDSNAYTINSRHNKARKNMTYQLPPALREELCNRLRANRNGLIFPSPVTGKKLVDISKPWRRIKRAAGIEKSLRIHDLRHILGYVGANAGLSEPVLAAILGHSSTKVTKRHYQIRAKTAAIGVEKIHGILSGNDTETISKRYLSDII